jgi:hypothetical protein
VAQLYARPEGSVRCGECRTDSPAADVHVDGVERLEGASDPGDMVAVIAGTCPACGARGTLTLSYGPGASADDADVLAALPAS